MTSNCRQAKMLKTSTVKDGSPIKMVKNTSIVLWVDFKARKHRKTTEVNGMINQLPCEAKPNGFEARDLEKLQNFVNCSLMD